MKREVVVTGVGAVTPLGVGARTLYERWRAGVSGIEDGAGQVNYSASKSGLVGLARSVTRELGGRGITANVVAPGFIETDMTKDLLVDVVKAIPARRAGTPEDVAAAVRFLASDRAGYVTGTTLFVDGGMSA